MRLYMCACVCMSVCAAGFCLNFLTEPLPEVEACRGLQRAVLPASSRLAAQPSGSPPPASQQNVPSTCTVEIMFRFYYYYYYSHSILFFPHQEIIQINFLFQIQMKTFYKWSLCQMASWVSGNAGFGSRCDSQPIWKPGGEAKFSEIPSQDPAAALALLFVRQAAGVTIWARLNPAD